MIGLERELRKSMAQKPTFYLHLRYCQDGHLWGTVQECREKEALPFNGAFSLLWQMDEKIRACPAFSEVEQLRGGWRLPESPTPQGGEEEAHCFLMVEVLYYQHTCWQGIVWTKNSRICFRSTLELMAIMRGVLEERMRGEKR